ncbi:MAG: hypothetical protein DRP56_03360 [Planctomycetota bacterium]|nr:MAG: hypothetical protein DRP56_03360 [Planctomycetota bacterium]
MRKNSVQWFLGLSAFAALCLIGLMLNPSVIYTRILSIVCVAGIIDAVVFFIGYGIFRKFEMLVFWKFAVYLAAKITLCLAIYFWHPRIDLSNVLLLSSIMFGVFVILNIILWKKLMCLTIRQACWTGIIVGLINTFFFGIGGLPIMKMY